MILIIGLGNPGEKFKSTRHNMGREIAQGFIKEARLSEPVFQKKWNAWTSEGKIGREKIAVIIPDTMMNKSGNAVLPAGKFYKAKPGQNFVIHDDADILLGRAKLSYAKRSAGHKGVESVMRVLKTRDFWRFRIGIAGKRNIPAEKLVLKKFTAEEIRAVKKVTKKTIAALRQAILQGPERATNEYNK